MVSLTYIDGHFDKLPVNQICRVHADAGTQMP